MKFSVFTVETPEYDLEQTVAKLKEYGYDGVEWRVAPALKGEPEVMPKKERWYWEYNKSTVDLDTIVDEAPRLKDISSRYGIEVCCLSTYLVPDEREKVEKVLKAAKIIGCPRIRVNVPKYTGEINYHRLFDKTVEDFKVLEAMAKQYGVKICFELHMLNITPGASSAYRLASHFSPDYIGVIHDAGNLTREGFEQWRMGLEILGPYLDHVHMKNNLWKVKETTADGEVIWEPEWCPLWKGQARLAEVLDELKRAGYDGYLSFEDFNNEMTTDEKLEKNLSYIKKLLG